MIGHDIVYLHPLNDCSAIGRAAQRDFLTYAQAVRCLSDGVYLSLRSAVMSPLIFDKSMAMAQNLALQDGETIDGHFLVVLALAPGGWDWSRDEPPDDRPEYYLRYNKTFSRMGGDMRYISLDNRDFLLGLSHRLDELGSGG